MIEDGTSRRGNPNATAVFAPQLNIQPIAVARDLEYNKFKFEARKFLLLKFSTVFSTYLYHRKAQQPFPMELVQVHIGKSQQKSKYNLTLKSKTPNFLTKTKTIEQVETASVL